MSLDVSIGHRFPGTVIDIQFSLPGHGITALFGPSGAGKSTAIGAIAGLFRPDTCRIAVDGAVLADTVTGEWQPPERRRVGLVFQDARLFPHMTVATNLRYGLRRAPPGPVRFDAVVNLLGLAPLLARRPRTLSGGEKQRVAIGRALLAQPRLLLLDEPLASLDAERKAEIIPYLRRLQRETAIPTVYVTHALEEVVQMATSLVLLDHGRVAAAGPLAALSSRVDLPLAARPDAAAVLELRVDAHDTARGLTRLDAGAVAIFVPLLDAPRGTPVRVRIAAQDVILAGPEAAGPAALFSVQNVLPGMVQALQADPAGRSALVEVGLGDGALLARVTRDAAERLRLARGSPVCALVKSVAVDVVRM